MDKIPTAAEYLDNTVPGNTWYDCEAGESVVERSFSESAMIEFAKMHCIAQREAILEKVNLRGVSVFDNSPDKIVDGAYEVDSNGPDYNFTVNKESMINAYPLENIK